MTNKINMTSAELKTYVIRMVDKLNPTDTLKDKHLNMNQTDIYLDGYADGVTAFIIQLFELFDFLSTNNQ